MIFYYSPNLFLQRSVYILDWNENLNMLKNKHANKLKGGIEEGLKIRWSLSVNNLYYYDTMGKREKW